MNITDIINQRLKLQSTVKALAEYGFEPNLEYFCSKDFYEIYSKWDQTKQNKFVVLLGGKVNFIKTKNLIEYNL